MFCSHSNGTSIWLQSWMNWVAFSDESEKRAPLLPRMPTGKPWMEAQPQMIVVP